VAGCPFKTARVRLYMHTTSIKKDLVIVLSITVASFLIFSQYDVLEMIVIFAMEHEQLEVDELVSSSIVFSACMAIYSYKWWRESLHHNSILTQKYNELERALDEIKTLRGIIPICSYCKKIRDGDDSWEQLESYIDAHSEAQFSHGVCPACYEKLEDSTSRANDTITG